MNFWSWNSGVLSNCPHPEMFSEGTLKTPICTLALENTFRAKAILAHPTLEV